MYYNMEGLSDYGVSYCNSCRAKILSSLEESLILPMVNGECNVRGHVHKDHTTRFIFSGSNCLKIIRFLDHNLLKLTNDSRRSFMSKIKERIPLTWLPSKKMKKIFLTSFAAFSINELSDWIRWSEERWIGKTIYIYLVFLDVIQTVECIWRKLFNWDKIYLLR